MFEKLFKRPSAIARQLRLPWHRNARRSWLNARSTGQRGIPWCAWRGNSWSSFGNWI